MKFNDMGFVKIKSKRYGDTIIIGKFDWVAKQAARKGHIAYSPRNLRSSGK